jgi:glycosyltransferase involved in cell wall biosynthesis
MKVALIGPAHPYRGGVAQHTTLLGRALRQRHHVLFISFSRQYPSWLFPGKSDRDPSRTADQEPCDYLLDPMNPVSWERTARAVARFKPDAMVLVWWVPFFAPAWTFLVLRIRAALRIPVITLCHNVLPHDKGKVQEGLARLALHWPDGFIVHSRSDENVLRNVRPGIPVIRVPLAPHPRPKAEVRAKEEACRILGISSRRTVFLFFGLVRLYKGLDILIEALAEAAFSGDVALLVVGEFWEPRESFDRQIRALGLENRVTVVDRYVPNEEMGLYFGAADVVVLPYRSATQSGVPQLAFSMGKPVIVTDVGGLAENIRGDEFGCVVPPNDPKELAKAMIAWVRRGVSGSEALVLDRQAWFERTWLETTLAMETLVRDTAKTRRKKETES